MRPTLKRGHQMLIVLEAILPLHLKHMQTLTTKKETPGGPRTELQMIHNVSVCMKTLIYNSEALTRLVFLYFKIIGTKTI